MESQEQSMSQCVATALCLRARAGPDTPNEPSELCLRCLIHTATAPLGWQKNAKCCEQQAEGDTETKDKGAT